MPELPEVETTRRGIHPHVENQIITDIVIRQHQLRWKIPHNLSNELSGKIVNTTLRRGKYLLLTIEQGALILHLGMSGSLRILTSSIPPAKKHDHVDIKFSNQVVLRFTDPRRFGALLWVKQQPYQHPLLINLGPEPLTHEFSTNYLWNAAQSRSTPIKSLIMDNKVVVGVGNIYAAESLFLAKINPLQPAKSLSRDRIQELVKAIKFILRQAIQRGGTTLKDFVNSEGKPGYFVNQLKVYGRDGLPCVVCSQPLSALHIGQRNTVYCAYCQRY